MLSYYQMNPNVDSRLGTQREAQAGTVPSGQRLLYDVNISREVQEMIRKQTRH